VPVEQGGRGGVVSADHGLTGRMIKACATAWHSISNRTRPAPWLN